MAVRTSETMSKGNRAAVIGAGPAGMAMTKELKEAGFEVTSFEKTGHIGGLWWYHDDDTEDVGSVMKTTIINTSKEISAYSEHPPPANYPNYMHNTMMLKYIISYTEKFGGMQHVKFYHEVMKVEKTDDHEETGRWKVTCKDTQTGQIVSGIFDCVTVAIGHHVYPNIPTFPGQEEYTGKILHSRSLKKAQGFEDMRIVVVGIGNSAMDAAVELSAVAKQVYLSSRRGAWIVPRVGPGGIPLDAFFTRRIISWCMQHLPYNISCSLTEQFLNNNFNHKLYNIKPKHRYFSQHPTMSDSLPLKLLSGTVVPRNSIRTFTRKGVIFEDEENETPVDAVVLCTGYQVKFPFLSQDILPVKDNKVKLYKYIFPPDLPHPTLAIVGLVQPNGPGIPVTEMQCRWTSRIMSGQLALPPKEKMYADIKRKDDYNRKRFTDSLRHTCEVEYINYQDELAEEIGAKPNLLKLAVADPKLFWALLFGPSLAYQYRLQGPQAWDGARDAILTYGKRLRAPFRKPGQKYIKRTELYNFSLIVKILICLSLICFLFFPIFKSN